MSQRLNLNGHDWQYKSFYGEDWLGRKSHHPAGQDRQHWHTGTVPGSVQYDLWQDGLIPDPYFEQNTFQIEWAAERTWVYKKNIAVDPKWIGKRIRLVFEGVDYYARFYLNGELLGSHSNMFTPASFDVDDKLSFTGPNLVAVVLDPAPLEQPQVGYTSKVRTMKSRMNYWWDFCPRLVHLGIWDDVYLEVSGPARLEDVFVHPEISPDRSHALVSVAVQASTNRSLPVEVEAIVLFQGEVIASQVAKTRLEAGVKEIDLSLDVDHPELWWPNGYGSQPLYEAEVSLIGADGSISDQIRISFGIRKVEVARNQDADPQARPYTLLVNGRRIYMKGWNWVPMDVLYGVERPQKLERLLKLAQDAHVNLLRVWGGGLIEREAFYNLCDRLGILVWQEFTQSSSGIDNHPSYDPEWIAWFVEQARQIIPRRRNHPSLLLWCGGNELHSGSDAPLDDGFSGKNTHPLLKALGNLVRELDPDALWLPTSSSGKVFSNSLENIEKDPLSLHDVHGPWEYLGIGGHQELCNRGTCLLHSEFGVEGITNRKTLDRVIDPKHQSPVDLENPAWYHLGAWWVKKPSWQATFGAVQDVPALAHATQWMQYDGLLYAVEADRRRKYHNSGSLPWQFNEPYPMAACTSAVDYRAQPKPAYYAVARAYEPLHLSARFETQAWGDRERFEASIWISNSQPNSIQDSRLEIALRDANGETCWSEQQEVGVAADASTRLFDISVNLAKIATQVFFLDLHLLSAEDELLSANRYAFSRTENLAPLLALPITRLEARFEPKDDCWEIHLANAGSQVAFGIWLQDESPARDLPLGSAETKGFVYFTDNYFSLFPGETRTLTARWEDIPEVERRLSIEGFNFETVWLEGNG